MTQTSNLCVDRRSCMARYFEPSPGHMVVAPVRKAEHPEGTVFLEPQIEPLPHLDGTNRRVYRKHWPTPAFENPSNCP